MRILALLGFYTVEVVRPSEFKRVKCVLFFSVTKKAVGTLYGGENRSKPCTFQVKTLIGTSEIKKQRTRSEKYNLHDKKHDVTVLYGKLNGLFKMPILSKRMCLITRVNCLKNVFFIIPDRHQPRACKDVLINIFSLTTQIQHRCSACFCFK